MKVKDQAITDLNACLSEFEESRDPNKHALYLVQVSLLMRKRGWKSVTPENLIDTARGIGFTVVGNTIYPMEW